MRVRQGLVPPLIFRDQSGDHIMKYYRPCAFASRKLTRLLRLQIGLSTLQISIVPFGRTYAN